MSKNTQHTEIPASELQVGDTYLEASFSRKLNKVIVDPAGQARKVLAVEPVQNWDRRTIKYRITLEGGINPLTFNTTSATDTVFVAR